MVGNYVGRQRFAECEAVHATAQDQALETICLGKDKRYENMVIAVRDASVLLEDYATALKAAADGKDVTVADDMTAVLTQVGALNTDRVKALLPGVYNVADVLAKDRTLAGKLTPSGVVTIVDTLVKFVSQGYRRHAIAEAVTESASHVDALAAFIEAEVALHLEDGGEHDSHGHAYSFATAASAALAHGPPG